MDLPSSNVIYTYFTQEGDTLSSLAEKYYISKGKIGILLRDNPHLLDRDKLSSLEPGTKVNINLGLIKKVHSDRAERLIRELLSQQR